MRANRLDKAKPYCNEPKDLYDQLNSNIQLNNICSPIPTITHLYTSMGGSNFGFPAINRFFPG